MTFHRLVSQETSSCQGTGGVPGWQLLTCRVSRGGRPHQLALLLGVRALRCQCRFQFRDIGRLQYRITSKDFGKRLGKGFMHGWKKC